MAGSEFDSEYELPLIYRGVSMAGSNHALTVAVTNQRNRLRCAKVQGRERVGPAGA